MTLSLGFHGGAGTVTGSKYLVSAGDRRVLVDCGLFQGLKELRLLNWEAPPFAPGSIDAVLLTHAHIDHSGYLPRLVRDGFTGPIYATEATIALLRILLIDAAKIQEEDARYANRKGFSKHSPALPLFSQGDARLALRRLKPVDYGETFRIHRLEAAFHDAGHILGSAVIAVTAPRGKDNVTLLFSGDLGRYGAPMHTDPVTRPTADTLVLEATYGGSLHVRTPFEDQIAGPFRETFSRGGIVLIPSFAVARAQLLTLLLRKMMESGQLETVPVHIDSPMAADVTDIYRRYLGSTLLDQDLLGESLFPQGTRFHRTVGESMQLNREPGPRIIIAGSGMLTGGRVLHHLRRLLPDARNLIVFTGFQPAGTRGRALLEGAATVRVHGGDVQVGAQVLSLEGLSAHADQAELLRWVKSNPEAPRTIFLSHGEPEALSALARYLSDEGYSTLVPGLGDEFQYDAPGDWRLLSGR